MLTIDARHCTLLIIDLQHRLMPAIDDGEQVVARARKLQQAAEILDIPMLLTEQNPAGLGSTTPDLAPGETIAKTHFDACREPGFLDRLHQGNAVVVAGCEAHVCVLQTVLGLRTANRRVFVVRDAIGSRAPSDKAAAIRRMERHGAEIVTGEMVLFEWLENSDHPRFRDVLRLVK